MRIGTILLSALLALSLLGCKSNVPADSQTPLQNICEEAPLMACAESQEEAEALARQYGITLVAWEHGIATFHTVEDPREVIQRGIREGLPELSLNYITPLS